MGGVRGTRGCGFGNDGYGGERSDFEDSVAEELDPFCEGGGAGVKGEWKGEHEGYSGGVLT